MKFVALFQVVVFVLLKGLLVTASSSCESLPPDAPTMKFRALPFLGRPRFPGYSRDGKVSEFRPLFSRPHSLAVFPTGQYPMEAAIVDTGNNAIRRASGVKNGGPVESVQTHGKAIFDEPMSVAFVPRIDVVYHKNSLPTKLVAELAVPYQSVQNVVAAIRSFQPPPNLHVPIIDFVDPYTEGDTVDFVPHQLSNNVHVKNLDKRNQIVIELLPANNIVNVKTHREVFNLFVAEAKGTSVRALEASSSATISNVAGGNRTSQYRDSTPNTTYPHLRYGSTARFRKPISVAYVEAYNPQLLFYTPVQLKITQIVGSEISASVSSAKESFLRVIPVPFRVGALFVADIGSCTIRKISIEPIFSDWKNKKISVPKPVMENRTFYRNVEAEQTFSVTTIAGDDRNCTFLDADDGLYARLMSPNSIASASDGCTFGLPLTLHVNGTRKNSTDDELPFNERIYFVNNSKFIAFELRDVHPLEQLLFVADGRRLRVVNVSSAGTQPVWTIAFSGARGTDDGVFANATALNLSAVAVKGFVITDPSVLLLNVNSFLSMNAIVYVTDRDAGTIRRLALGMVTTVFGGDEFFFRVFGAPTSIIMSPLGPRGLFVTDATNHTVVWVTATTMTPSITIPDVETVSDSESLTEKLTGTPTSSKTHQATTTLSLSRTFPISTTPTVDDGSVSVSPTESASVSFSSSESRARFPSLTASPSQILQEDLSNEWSQVATRTVALHVLGTTWALERLPFLFETEASNRSSNSTTPLLDHEGFLTSDHLLVKLRKLMSIRVLGGEQARVRPRGFYVSHPFLMPSAEELANNQTKPLIRDVITKVNRTHLVMVFQPFQDYFATEDEIIEILFHSTAFKGADSFRNLPAAVTITLKFKDRSVLSPRMALLAKGAAVTTSLLGHMASKGGMASFSARVTTVLALQSCTRLSSYQPFWFSAPLQIGIRTADLSKTATFDPLQYLTGTAVGNTLLVVGLLLTHYLVVFYYARCMTVSVDSARSEVAAIVGARSLPPPVAESKTAKVAMGSSAWKQRLGIFFFPSLSAVYLLFLAQPTFGAMVGLVVHGSGVSVTLQIVGGILCLVWALLVGIIALFFASSFGAEYSKPEDADWVVSVRGENRRGLEMLYWGKGSWISDDLLKPENIAFVSRWTHYFTAYRKGKEWFIFVEFAIAFVAGSVADAPFPSNGDCSGAVKGFAVCVCLRLLLIMLLQPYAAILEAGVNVLFGILEAAGTILIAVSVVGRNVHPAPSTAAAQVGTTAAPQQLDDSVAVFLMRDRMARIGTWLILGVAVAGALKATFDCFMYARRGIVSKNEQNDVKELQRDDRLQDVQQEKHSSASSPKQKSSSNKKTRRNHSPKSVDDPLSQWFTTAPAKEEADEKVSVVGEPKASPKSKIVMISADMPSSDEENGDVEVQKAWQQLGGGSAAVVSVQKKIERHHREPLETKKEMLPNSPSREFLRAQSFTQQWVDRQERAVLLLCERMPLPPPRRVVTIFEPAQRTATGRQHVEVLNSQFDFL